MDLGISGLASGFDWRSFVDQMVSVERGPQNMLRTQQAGIQQRNAALSTLKTQLAALQSKLADLKNPDLFEGRSVSSSDDAVATATAGAGTVMGSFAFSVQQLATSAAWSGAPRVSNPLSTSADVSQLSLSASGFNVAVTPGVFTINGKRVEVAATDTLGGVFDKISAATGQTVTAAYDPATDGIKLSGSAPIVLGSATDTTNFLRVAKLSNNGTAEVASSGRLGAVRLNAAMAQSNLQVPISNGTGPTGEFKVNGVSITFDTAKDSVAAVLNRINSSSAGVIAGYDAANDRFTLTNRSTGDVGVALEDVSGNFLAGTGLLAGELRRGKDLIYSVNGGSALTSASNTVTAASSGIEGLSVTFTAEADVSITVGSNTEAVAKAISDFVAEYNKTQSLLGTQLASSTNAEGKVTAGPLASDSEVIAINGQLRKLATGDVPGLTGVIRRLDALGFKSNGNDDSLTPVDADTLKATLAKDLQAVKSFFAQEPSGLAAGFDKFFKATIEDSGTLVKHQSTLTSQSASIDLQIADMERWVQVKRQNLINSFVAMETAQQQINQQLQFLQKQFASTGA